jgi:hypothetical protein
MTRAKRRSGPEAEYHFSANETISAESGKSPSFQWVNRLIPAASFAGTLVSGYESSALAMVPPHPAIVRINIIRKSWLIGMIFRCSLLEKIIFHDISWFFSRKGHLVPSFR